MRLDFGMALWSERRPDRTHGRELSVGFSMDADAALSLSSRRITSRGIRRRLVVSVFGIKRACCSRRLSLNVLIESVDCQINIPEASAGE
jgi:hypothetical protein